MNKELIVKFEKVFLHWVHGGAVLKYSYCPTSIPVDDGTWSKLGDFYNWGAEYIAYVIDDEYVELRKALALGGTIQYFNRDTGVWQDCVNQTEADREFHTPVSEYRVKSTAKVGDWVRLTYRFDNSTKHTIERLTGEGASTYHFDSSISGRVSVDKTRADLEIWKPQLKEWCWYNHDHTRDRLTLVQFMGSETPSKFEPFIGVLPRSIEVK